MALRRVVRFVDDFGEGEAAETVVFGLDGVDYEIDLSAGHAARLRAALDRYVAAARMVGDSGPGQAARVRDAAARLRQAPRPPVPDAVPPREAVPDAVPPREAVPGAGPILAAPPVPTHTNAVIRVDFSDRPAQRTADG